MKLWDSLINSVQKKVFPQQKLTFCWILDARCLAGQAKINVFWFSLSDFGDRMDLNNWGASGKA
jgi:hypothetical protein